jgi:hypothetical protein
MHPILEQMAERLSNFQRNTHGLSSVDGVRLHPYDWYEVLRDERDLMNYTCSFNRQRAFDVAITTDTRVPRGQLVIEHQPSAEGFDTAVKAAIADYAMITGCEAVGLVINVKTYILLSRGAPYIPGQTMFFDATDYRVLNRESAVGNATHIPVDVHPRVPNGHFLVTSDVGGRAQLLAAVRLDQQPPFVWLNNIATINRVLLGEPPRDRIVTRGVMSMPLELYINGVGGNTDDWSRIIADRSGLLGPSGELLSGGINGIRGRCTFSAPPQQATVEFDSERYHFSETPAYQEAFDTAPAHYQPPQQAAVEFDGERYQFSEPGGKPYNRDIVKEIDDLLGVDVDELVDQQMRGSYEQPERLKRCSNPACDYWWHALPITQRMHEMREQRHYDEGYDYRNDKTRVLCQGSEKYLQHISAE